MFDEVDLQVLVDVKHAIFVENHMMIPFKDDFPFLRLLRKLECKTNSFLLLKGLKLL